MGRHIAAQPQPKSGSNAGWRLDERWEKPAKEAAVPSLVREVLKSPGVPLDVATRDFMEPRFGHDFGRVRVHADARAAESARAVNALAYTAGCHIVFDGFRPQTEAGTRLLAHELAHVVQQGQRDPTAVASIAPVSSPQEAEAQHVASGVLAGGRVTATAGAAAGLARQSAGPEPDKPATLPPPTQSAPAEREREVQGMVVGDEHYVLYQKEVRSKGSSSWLANNPGNMDYTPEQAGWGAYEGKSLPWGQHRFAIFPDEFTGLVAVRKYLRANQRMRDIKLMMHMFAPAGDVDNDPDRYANQVAAHLKVPVTTLVKDLNDSQIEAYADKIKEIEGWKVGATYARDDPSLPPAVRGR